MCCTTKESSCTWTFKSWSVLFCAQPGNKIQNQSVIEEPLHSHSLSHSLCPSFQHKEAGEITVENKLYCLQLYHHKLFIKPQSH